MGTITGLIVGLASGMVLVLFFLTPSEINDELRPTVFNNTGWCQCDAQEQWDMYYENDNWDKYYNATLTGVWGLAHGDYITVWTKDRTITQVLETCTHEYAHNNLNLTHEQ